MSWAWKHQAQTLTTRNNYTVVKKRTKPTDWWGGVGTGKMESRSCLWMWHSDQGFMTFKDNHVTILFCRLNYHTSFLYGMEVFVMQSGGLILFSVMCACQGSALGDIRLVDSECPKSRDGWSPHANEVRTMLNSMCFLWDTECSLYVYFYIVIIVLIVWQVRQNYRGLKCEHKRSCCRVGKPCDQSWASRKAFKIHLPLTTSLPHLTILIWYFEGCLYNTFLL